jgi:hypothetical protein
MLDFQPDRRNVILKLSLRLIVATLLILAAGAALSQPYGGYLTNSAGHGYIQIPNSTALTFAGGSFTFEAWVSLANSSCSSIAGNNWLQSTWIGICGSTLRSYVRGSSSLFDAGTIPASDWTHIAVTFDNATNRRTHYIDGEEVGSTIDEGDIAATTGAWRIFSDISYEFTPNGAIDEVRFWNVARTKEQIRSTINTEINAPQPGLVAVYELDGDPTDQIGTANGSRVGTSANYLTTPIGAGCVTSASTLCLGPSGRFAVRASYKTASTSGNASVVPFSTSESGLFTFFSATNWEAVVKVVNGCGITNHWWVFAGGLTDQHTELEITDQTHGVVKRYFNYAGVPFAPITDVNALATCP